jgi:hypothetical protein
MIRLRDKETGSDIGTITEEELQFLMDSLEEEDDEDRDYYLNAGMIDILEQNGAGSELLQLLKGAIVDKDGIEIEWTEE